MVFVHEDAVEAIFGREFELVHEIVVDAVGAFGVEEAGVDVDSDGGMLLAEVLREIGVGHEVEPQKLHGFSRSDARVSCGSARFGSSGLAMRRPVWRSSNATSSSRSFPRAVFRR